MDEDDGDDGQGDGGQSDVPWRGVFSIFVFPIAGIALGAALFAGINVNDGRVTALAAATPANVRTIIDQVLKSDLTADRLKEAFEATGAAPPGTVCTSFADTAGSEEARQQPPPKAPAVNTASRQTVKAPAQTAPQKPATKPSAQTPAERAAAAAKTKAAADQRLACRALLATRLSADQPQLALAQPVADAVMGRPVEATFWVDGSALKLPQIDGQKLNDAIGTWLADLKRDPFTAQAIARGWDAKEALTSELQPRIARLLSADRLQAALARALDTDFSGAMTGSAVPVWSKDVTARLVWATMMFIFCGAFVFVMVAAIDQLIRLPRSETRYWVIVAVVTVLALSTLEWVYLDQAGVNLSRLDAALTFVAQRYHVDTALVLRALKLLVITGTVFLIVGSVATFVVRVTDADGVTAQVSGLRALFNAGTVFMLAGVLTINALFRWPAVFQSSTNAQPLLDAANWVATACGAVFTVVLLSVYVSSVTVLRDQVRHFADADKRNAAAKAFDNLSFGPGGGQLLLRLMQVLAPVVTGAAISTFSSF